MRDPSALLLAACHEGERLSDQGLTRDGLHDAAGVLVRDPGALLLATRHEGEEGSGVSSQGSMGCMKQQVYVVQHPSALLLAACHEDEKGLGGSEQGQRCAR